MVSQHAAPWPEPGHEVSLVIQQPLRLIREGLQQLLSSQRQLAVAGVAVHTEGLMRLCAEHAPDVVVISGDAVWWEPVQLAVAVRRLLPSARFVVTIGSSARLDIRLLQGHGLHRWVRHSDGIEHLVSAVFAAAAAPPDRLKAPPDHACTTTVLTTRESSILERIGQGLTTREISDELDVASRGVENSKRRIFSKLGVSTQAEAVAVALQRGLLVGR